MWTLGAGSLEQLTVSMATSGLVVTLALTGTIFTTQGVGMIAAPAVL